MKINKNMVGCNKFVPRFTDVVVFKIGFFEAISDVGGIYELFIRRRCVQQLITCI